MRKIFLLLAVLLVVLLAVAHVMLERHFTLLVRAKVLPELRARYQTEIELERISVNLLTGTLSVQGLNVGNPPAFDEPAMARLGRFRLRLALSDLLVRDTVTIRDLRIDAGELFIVRNRHGRLNLAGPAPDRSSDVPLPDPEVQPAPAPAPDSAPSPSPTDPPAAARPARAPKPRVALRKARMHARAEYIDHSQIFRPEPLRLALDMNLYAQGLANHGPADVLDGILIVDGVVKVGDRGTDFELRGKTAPLTDARRASFDLTGATRIFDLLDAPPLAAWLGVEKGRVVCAVNLVVRDGAFDQGKSLLKFDFSDIRVTPEARRRFQGINLPENFTLSLPLGGTLENPRVDFAAAIARLLAGGDIIRSMLQDIRLPSRSASKSESLDP